MLVGIPPVEVADDGDRVGVGRPHPERRAVVGQLRSEDVSQAVMAATVEEPTILFGECCDHEASLGPARVLRPSHHHYPGAILKTVPPRDTMYISPNPSVPNEASELVARLVHVFESTVPLPS